MRIAILIVVTLALATIYVNAATHPYEGQKVNQVAGYPDQATPSWNYGDLTFVGPSNMPRVQQLTNAERYIVAGSATSPFSSRAGLPSWQISLWTAVSRIHSETGSVPAQLTPAVLRASKYYRNSSDAELSVLKSPITKDWPYLNAKQFSAGNAFFHPLNRAEMEHFASLSPIYGKQWFEGKGLDPKRAKVGGTIEELYTAPYRLDGPVWYVCIYGEEKVLINTLTYAGHSL
jgi:hypothetical protein